MRNFSVAVSLIICAILSLPVAMRAQVNEKVERERVLRQLDESAKNFHNAAADFEFLTHQQDPVPDDDVQKGTAYYQRDGKKLKMSAHFKEHNGQPINNIYTFTDGVFRLYEGATSKVSVYDKFSQYESYFSLGFGASGRELEEMWEIKYLGSEMLDGVKTEKLELVAKDPAARKTIQKITMWMDAQRGVSLKQVLTESGGEYRVNHFFNFNQTLPKSAFALPAGAK
jgi:outer membrane lipoprotein-sorting protein